MTLDPASMDPGHYTVEYEDDRVRVLRIAYGPGEKSPMHEHPDSVLVGLTAGRARFTFPDGSTDEISWSAGEVVPLPATTHEPENPAAEAFEVIQIEIKG
jgi:quercetin dioxygenase-like cupin family protein